MINMDQFCNFLLERKYSFFTGVPCSILKPLINYVIDNRNLKFFIASSEGEAMGIAAGIALAKQKPVVLMQNSGLGNAINPLTSLHLVYNLPVLIIISLRGEPGTADEPQHKIMGQITCDFLKIMNIPFQIMSADQTACCDQLRQIDDYVNKSNRPAAMVIKKGLFSPYEIKNKLSGSSHKSFMKRKEAIQEIASNLKGDEVVISTTGKISRELFSASDSEQNFYVVGSMGCANAIAFGIAETKPDKKVLVLDGDGALLMKMGNISTIGFYKPDNLIHLVIDNETHDSTGGQATTSSITKFHEIALSAGYRTSKCIHERSDLRSTLHNSINSIGPHFIHIKVLKGSDESLGRPTLTTEQIKNRFMAFLNR